jgi:flagellin
MLSILNNIPALQAENALDVTTTEANNSLEQLSTGSRINSGSDDAAGLAISDGLNANVAALNQSSLNVTDGVGELQTADGAMSQITSLLNRAVTIATEASNGTVSSAQLGTINTEFQAILGEINNIGTTTNYNGQAIFSQSTGVTDATIGSTNTTYGTATAANNDLDLFTSDGTAGGTKTFSVTVNAVDSVALGLTTGTGTGVSNLDLLTQSDATTALTALTNAVASISQDRGTLGATVEQLQAASQVDTTESTNLTSASSDITSADIGQVVANDTSYSILEQTGISALQQASQQQENVLKLLQ